MPNLPAHEPGKSSEQSRGRSLMVKLRRIFALYYCNLRAFICGVFCFSVLFWFLFPLHAWGETGRKADSEGDRIPSPAFVSATLGGRSLTEDMDTVLRFPPELNTLEVEFTVPGLSKKSQPEYEIRLRDLEKDWHSTRLSQSRYPALAPGSYVFEVRSRVGSGPWSLPTSLAFEITRPSWRALPAGAMWVLLIASAALAIFYWGVHKYRKRALELENLLSARTIELAMANADLERLSVTDPLTSLKNRRFVEFSITEDLARVRRSIQEAQNDLKGLKKDGANISFLLIDIDYFKRVNDRYGHPAGDEVLQQMSRIFSSAIRESDTAVRWGGEEFLIIARSSQANDPAVLAQRICGQVQSAGFVVNEEQTIRLTCSIGFASWPFFRCEPDALGWREVLALADRCLYLVKNSGRNSWIGVRTPMDYEGPADVESLNDFRSAETKGIIRIQSSLSPGRRAVPFYSSSRRSSTSRIYH
jgi:diguanylate cyclase (GGDEF)-like protein